MKRRRSSWRRRPAAAPALEREAEEKGEVPARLARAVRVLQEVAREDEER